jgi:hypothetical protein
MAQTPDYKVDPTLLARLTFRRELCNYVYYSESNGRTYGYLYETDEPTYTKIKDILSGSDTAQVKKGDRIFVLPGNTLPLKRIRTYAKSVGAFVTNEIEKATVIAGNWELEAEDAEYQAKFAHAVFRTESYRYVEDNSHLYDQDLEDTFDDLIPGHNSKRIYNEFTQGVPCIISETAASNAGYDPHIAKMDEERYFLYPVAMNALYYALAKKLPIISQEYLNDNAHSDLDLSDPEVYKSLADMFGSSDSSNRRLAVQVMVHAKFDNEDPLCNYHIWLLQKDYYSIINNYERDKNVKHFLDTSNWYAFVGENTREYLKIALEKDVLTKEIFLKLLDEVREEERDSFYESEFYELTHEGNTGFVYRLKSKWLKLLNPELIEEHEKHNT